MSFLHEEYGTDAEIYRKPLGTEVIADSSDPRAHRILVACGFVEKTAPPAYRWHQLPEGLAEDEQQRRATRALCLLLGEGLDAHIADDLLSDEVVAAVLSEIGRHRTDTRTAALSASPAASTTGVPVPVAPETPTAATHVSPAHRHGR